MSTPQADAAQTKAPVIAVDGPAGSGKSSISSTTAKALGLLYLNSGTLYRLAAHLAIDGDIPIAKHSLELLALLDKALKLTTWRGKHFFFKGKNITSALLSKEVSQAASEVAAIPELRQKLLVYLRETVDKVDRAIIIDGRDIGTVVFPEAALKVYMFARIEARAKRREQQLIRRAMPCPPLAEITREIQLRDKRDGERGTAPLIRAQDAIDFDTSDLTFRECVERFCMLIKSSLTL